MTQKRLTQTRVKIMNAQNNEIIVAYVTSLNDAFASRKAYEAAKNEENIALQKKLDNMLASASHNRIAEILCYANVDASLINKSERINARFNEKAYVKVVNIARAIAKVETLNIYTRAILESVKSFQDNETLISQKETKSACSCDAKLSDSKRNKLLKRVVKHYDASTTSTQSSSTNQALLAFNVLIETRNAANEICFSLNLENETTKALLALCA